MRTALTAMASFLIAQLFRLPEPYWAPIKTTVITQSSLGAALNVSSQRFVGTILGALVGAIMAAHFWTARTCIWRLHTDFRFALRTGGLGPKRVSLRGCYLAIILLIPRREPSLANCPAPVRRSVHWDWRRFAFNNSVARDGEDDAAQDLNTNLTPSDYRRGGQDSSSRGLRDRRSNPF